MSGVELFYEDATMREGFAGNVHLVAWYDAPTADQMRQYGVGSRILHGRYPEASGLLNLVVTGKPVFASEVRELAREYTREGLHNAGAAHVVLVDGLLGGAVRGFLGTTVLLGRPPNPTKVFGNMHEGVHWLVEQLNGYGDMRWTSERLGMLAEPFVARLG